MNKLLIYVLVLGLTSMVMATPVLRIDPKDVRDDFYPGKIITIQLYDSGSVIGMEVDAFTDNPSGTALGSAVLDAYNSNWNVTQNTSLNVDGLLVEGMAAAETVIGASVTGVLYSFEYRVPKVPFSTMLIIGTYNDGGNNWYLAEIDYADGSRWVAPPELCIVIHNLPEPATLALLSFGAVMVRRKR